MHKELSIQHIKQNNQKNRVNLPEETGVYAFWWMGSREELMEADCLKVLLKGPKGILGKIEFEDWWPPELEYPCLYVGKSTNLKKRFALHIKNGSSERLHSIPASGEKQKAVTTSCQLRYGIEHIFCNSKTPLDIIFNKVGFSYTTDFPDRNSIAERFYTEDRLIGIWRPWFNVDSER